ncbi:MAG TPA: cysteine desulfurase family protein [Mesorhizobium sp.]|jgi:cysteine desulfurase|nr:cysteine desulfurase family protein [Mesorhizobium sp.]
MTGQRAYLDHNASAPLLAQARAAMLDALDSANPSSVHGEGRAARRLIERARGQVAALVGGRAEGVVFSSGATEAASMLLSPDWGEGRTPLRFSRLYVGAADHPCMLKGGRFDAERVTVLPVGGDGLLNLAALTAALAGHDDAEGRPLVATHAANNETGVVQPWPEIAGIVSAAGGVFVLDAVQAAGRLPLDMEADGVDFTILSSHKIGGPKGIGAVVARSDRTMPRPLIAGGGQERGFRGGTENVPAIAGFGAAAEAAVSRLASMERVATLRARFEAALLALAPDAVIHGRSAPRLPNTLFFTIPGIKAETAQIAFDLAGVALSAGSACSSGKVGPSHVLRAMGVERGEGALRISIGPETGEAELQRFERSLRLVVAKRQAPSENLWDEAPKVERRG